MTAALGIGLECDNGGSVLEDGGAGFEGGGSGGTTWEGDGS